jgi:putative PIN family toxin of toxin-antitoxin system
VTRTPAGAVFDCVVFAQALINPRGPAAEYIERARDGQVRLFASQYLFAEIRELPSKLPARYGVTTQQVEDLIAELVTFAKVVDVVPDVYVHPIDPDDSHYVNLAVACSAMLVVSRDRHLLVLMEAGRREGADFRQRFPQLEVITPDELARRLRDADVGESGG